MVKKLRHNNLILFQYTDVLAVQCNFISILQLFKWWRKNKSNLTLKKICLNPCTMQFKIQSWDSTNATTLTRIEEIKPIEKFLIPAPFTNYFKKKISWSVYDYPFKNDLFTPSYKVDKFELTHYDDKFKIVFDRENFVGGLLFIDFIRREIEEETNKEIKLIEGVNWEMNSLNTLILYLNTLDSLEECNLSEKIECVLHPSSSISELRQQIYYYEENKKPVDYWLNRILKNDVYFNSHLY